MRILSTFLGLMAATTAAPAFAQAAETIGKPEPKGLGFQPAATELARQIQSLDGLILTIITIITVFVTALLIYCIVRYNRRANPTPGTFTHNTPLEIAWTLGPILILVLIGSFSLPVLFNQQEIPEGEVHIKVTGYQWYWGYEYTDHEFAFDSFLLAKEELAANGYNEDEYLLATDTKVVVPIGKTVVMDVTGADVIHSWTIPSFGVKQDAVPGRIAQLWFKAEKEGIYFGQCSELCGKDHAYMPITVEVVSEDKYNEWLKGAIEEYAGDMSTLPAIEVASAD
ncbi:cytochrome c oxidase subunit II [Shimia sp.]|uniref:cytochrome c oxidase subunit II n=1 Tax=unclassified Shimia TaxID=2630038 RepID=UPI0025ED1843|nr:cytochrome c oxidase subunit II [Shimia sp.]MCH2066287.1 cytochrome c oxidase subunit II [Shimia sp.]